MAVTLTVAVTVTIALTMTMAVTVTIAVTMTVAVTVIWQLQLRQQWQQDSGGSMMAVVARRQGCSGGSKGQ